jgi:hypothetical protein
MSVDILLIVGIGTSTSTPKRVVWNLVRRHRERSNIDSMLSSAVLRFSRQRMIQTPGCLVASNLWWTGGLGCIVVDCVAIDGF